MRMQERAWIGKHPMLQICKCQFCLALNHKGWWGQQESLNREEASHAFFATRIFFLTMQNDASFGWVAQSVFLSQFLSCSQQTGNNHP
jgi:hypothetical protein